VSLRRSCMGEVVNFNIYSIMNLLKLDILALLKQVIVN
jgi:hypothetical protein